MKLEIINNNKDRMNRMIKLKMKMKMNNQYECLFGEETIIQSSIDLRIDKELIQD